MNKGFKRIIFEFLSIVVAVLLAMGLTEWRQEILNKRQAEKSYESILEEVQNNHENLLPDSTSMADLITKIDNWLDSEKEARDTIGSFDYELNLLSKSAWDVAKFNSSMTYIDNDRLQGISLVYEFHDFYVRSGSEVFDALTELMKINREDDEYEGGMRALRLKVGLTYNSLVGYLASSRQIMGFSAPSD